MKDLHKHISASHLPKNYDGLLPALDYGGKEWYPLVHQYEDKVKQWNTYGFKK